MQKTIELKTVSAENSLDFHQGMVSRMDVSFAKYGRFRVNAAGKINPKYTADLINTLSDFLARWDNKQATTANSNTVSSILLRIIKYLRTGNTEWLMDTANFAMIEFECPQIQGAKFRATDSHESPGLVGISEKEMQNLG